MLRGRSLFFSLLVLALVGCGGAGKPQSPKKTPADLAHDCAFKLKNIGQACEIYSTDHNGMYPDSLQDLVPKYLTAVPKCPVAEHDTYSAAYEVDNSGHPQLFHVCCKGKYHADAGLAEDQPAYDCQKGLTPKQ